MTADSHWTIWLELALLAEQTAVNLTRRSADEVRRVLGQQDPHEIVDALYYTSLMEAEELVRLGNEDGTVSFAAHRFMQIERDLRKEVIEEMKKA